MRFEIWVEGWCKEIGASFLGTYYAGTFEEAIAIFLDRHPAERRYYKRNGGVHSIWDCRLYDNEIDARKSFG